MHDEFETTSQLQYNVNFISQALNEWQSSSQWISKYCKWNETEIIDISADQFVHHHHTRFI